MSDKKTVIVGVGNVLMKDDGLGPAVIEELRKAGVHRKADLINAGNAFHRVVFDLEKYDRVIIVDAVKGTSPPGTLHRFDIAQLRAMGRGRIASIGLSVHELSVLPTLLFQEMYQDKFKNLVFIGVQPEKVTWEEGLTQTVRRALPAILEAICKEIQEG